MIRQLRTLTRSSVLLMISLQSWTVSGKTAFGWSAGFEVLLNCCTRRQQKTLASSKAACCLITLKKIQLNLNDYVSWCSGFCPFMVTHFNAVTSAFPDSFQQVGVRPRGWQVSSPHLHSLVDATVSSLKVCVWSWLLLCCMEWNFPSIIQCLYASESVFYWE
jgi:hypothetical protein